MSDANGFPGYIEGGSARLVAELRDVNGELISGVAMRLVVLAPGETASFVNDTTVENDQCVGIISLTTHGVWRYRFESLVEPYAVYEDTFLVARRTVPAPA